MESKKTILVTGGCGFIGSHLVEKLVEKQYKVRILDDLSTGNINNLNRVAPNDVEVMVGNVAELSVVEAAVKGCDSIFHKAAIASVPKSVRDPVKTGMVNYGGTLNVLEAARKYGIRRVIFAGSAAVYGNEPTLPKKESMNPCPNTPYAVDKLASEHMGQVYAQMFGLEFVSLRYFNVFGPRQNPDIPYSGAISIFCDKMLQGIAPVIYGNGLQSRDFIHISDVVRANLLVMEHPKAADKIFNVGRGVSTTLLEIIEEINYLTGQNLQPIYKEARFGDIRHSLADNTELKSLGWSPIVNIREGLADMLKTQT